MVLLSSVFSLLLFSAVGFAETLQVDSSLSKVSFVAVGRPSMMKIRGEGGKIEGEVGFSKKENLGDLKVDLDSFDTGVELRNRHMKEKYLETSDSAKRYAILTLTKLDISPEFLKNGGKAELPFTGKLMLHGESKEISGKIAAEVSSEKFTGTTRFSIVLPDYKIQVPSYLGITVAETVEVDVSLQGKLIREESLKKAR